MTVDDMIEVFAGSDLEPTETIQAALVDWGAAGPRFLALLHDYVHGHDVSEQTERALYIIVHLLAEKAETAAFKDLCRLGEQSDKLDSVYGPDAYVYSCGGVLVSTFDGDPAPLYHLVDCEEADEYTRTEALLVVAYLACSCRIAEDGLYSYLSQLAARLPDRESDLWYGFARAVSALGFAGLSGVVEAAYKRQFITEPEFTSLDFWRELRLTQSAGRDVTGPEWATLHPIESALEQLRMLAELPASADGQLPHPSSYAVQEPIRNVLRSVGRNDPCPCGSGKKFKKCCLQSGAG